MRAPFGARLGWGCSPALLVVDAVAAYTEAGSPLYLPGGAAAAVEAMAALIAAARSGGRPAVWTTVSYASGGHEAALFRAKVPALSVFSAGGPLGAWPPAVAPTEDDWVIAKHHASAFFGTDLASGLAARRVDTVVVCGFSTSGCVRASAVDALQSGLRPMIVADACADRGNAPHQANLYDLQAKYADVVSLAEAVDRLGTP